MELNFWIKYFAHHIFLAIKSEFNAFCHQPRATPHTQRDTRYETQLIPNRNPKSKSLLCLETAQERSNYYLNTIFFAKFSCKFLHFIFNIFCEFLSCVVLFAIAVELIWICFRANRNFHCNWEGWKLGLKKFSFKFQTPDTWLNTMNDLNSTNKIRFRRRISEHNLNVALLCFTAQLFADFLKEFLYFLYTL